MKGTVITRPLTNQPTGWKDKKRLRMHYCKNHNYTLYPENWTDNATGRQFKAGYYDENGQYYDKISFCENGCYSSILCHCPYCGTDAARTLRPGDQSNLICESCGGALEIKGALDTYTQDPDYTNRDTKGTAATAIITMFLTFAVSCLFMMGIDFITYISDTQNEPCAQTQATQSAPASNVDIYGSTIYMKRTGDGEYTITDVSADYDKKLTWDYGYESYYDKDSDCYVWFNTDVSPNLWQYWYEGISSDYGDYGWMEYEPSGWYIEKSEGSWEKIDVSAYGSRIWHFPIDGRDFE